MSDLNDLARLVVRYGSGLTTERARTALTVATEFSESVQSLSTLPSTPAEEIAGLGWALLGMAGVQVETREVDPGSKWEYTFRPEIEAALPDMVAATGHSRYYLGMLIEQVIGAYANPITEMTPIMSKRRRRLWSWARIYRQHQRDIRARKRARRQRRAAQRRHQRGMR